MVTTAADCVQMLQSKSFCFTADRFLTDGRGDEPREFLYKQLFTFLPQDEYATIPRNLGDAYFTVGAKHGIRWLGQHGYRPEEVAGEESRVRYFKELPTKITSHTFVRHTILTMAGMAAHIINEDVLHGVIVGMRNICDGDHGTSTPFGVHRDGGDLIGVILIGRKNIRGGRSRMLNNGSALGHDWHTTKYNVLAEHTLINSFEAVWFLDQRVYHEAKSFTRLTESEDCIRDVLIIDLMRKQHFDRFFHPRTTRLDDAVSKKKVADEPSQRAAIFVRGAPQQSLPPTDAQHPVLSTAGFNGSPARTAGQQSGTSRPVEEEKESSQRAAAFLQKAPTHEPPPTAAQRQRPCTNGCGASAADPDGRFPGTPCLAAETNQVVCNAVRAAKCKVAVAVDIGGTRVKLGWRCRRGDHPQQAFVGPTSCIASSSGNFTQNLVQLMHELCLTHALVTKVAISIAGTVSVPSGIVINSSPLEKYMGNGTARAWDVAGAFRGAMLSRGATGLEVNVMNDAAALSLGVLRAAHFDHVWQCSTLTHLKAPTLVVGLGTSVAVSILTEIVDKQFVIHLPLHWGEDKLPGSLSSSGEHVRDQPIFEALRSSTLRNLDATRAREQVESAVVKLSTLAQHYLGLTIRSVVVAGGVSSHVPFLRLGSLQSHVITPDEAQIDFHLKGALNANVHPMKYEVRCVPEVECWDRPVGEPAEVQVAGLPESLDAFSGRFEWRRRLVSEHVMYEKRVETGSYFIMYICNRWVVVGQWNPPCNCESVLSSCGFLVSTSAGLASVDQVREFMIVQHQIKVAVKVVAL